MVLGDYSLMSKIDIDKLFKKRIPEKRYKSKIGLCDKY